MVDSNYYRVTTVVPVTYNVLHDGQFIGWMIMITGSRWSGYVFATDHHPAVKVEPQKDPLDMAQSMVDTYKRGHSEIN